MNNIRWAAIRYQGSMYIGDSYHSIRKGILETYPGTDKGKLNNCGFITENGKYIPKNEETEQRIKEYSQKRKEKK